MPACLPFLRVRNSVLLGPPRRREGRYEIRKVEHVEVHPDFKSSDTNQNNLALLRLNKPSKHKPVAIADGAACSARCPDRPCPQGPCRQGSVPACHRCVRLCTA